MKSVTGIGVDVGVGTGVTVTVAVGELVTEAVRVGDTENEGVWSEGVLVALFCNV